MYEDLPEIRWGILALMMVAIIGPWFYEVINVPSPNPCTEGTRIDDDFCGIPVSGLQVFAIFFMNIFSSVFWLVTGDVSMRELLGSLGVILFFLPIISLLFLSLRRDNTNSKGEKFNIGVLLIALILGVLVTVSKISATSGELWGLWFYKVTIFCALVLELMSMQTKRKMRNSPDKSVQTQ